LTGGVGGCGSLYKGDDENENKAGVSMVNNWVRRGDNAKLGGGRDVKTEREKKARVGTDEPSAEDVPYDKQSRLKRTRKRQSSKNLARKPVYWKVDKRQTKPSEKPGSKRRKRSKTISNRKLRKGKTGGGEA